MLQVLFNHDAGRLCCCHSDSNALQYSQRFRKDVIYGIRGKRNANISHFGSRRKLKFGSKIYF